MSLNVIDVVIVLFLLAGALLGFKKGAIQSIASLVGVILVVVLAYILKNPVSELLYTYLPFFKLGGIFEGITVINILIYEAIAFFIVLSILAGILGIILKITGVISKIVDYSIILTLPSKLIGLLVGLLESYIFIFIILFLLSQFNVTNNLLKNSSLTDLIITKTPYTDDFKKSYKAFEEIGEIGKSLDNSKKDYESLDTLLKYDIISADGAIKLIEKDKINIKGAKKLIESYEVK